ncbi:acyltransferase family protein [Spirosoma sp.]|uniref:acyltransferase family protein n=1 Tax=Spirosoma sp. TaxID=1899569 RepID=UPI00260EDEA0|nr:acyltransferase family protein [Spirosoma sp.]MCX6213925.1 acyltransferase family protein [Spirosoma sp.]
MPFVQFGWEVKNVEHSIFLDRLIIWLHQWRLPLLFFIAGVGVSFSLRKRSILSFMGERVVRLFVPLLFSMFFVIPVQVYVERLQKKEIDESYWSFYPSVWDMVPYPEGTLTWSHLWFVVYLFVFTILLTPFFALFKIKLLQRWKQRLNPVFTHPVANLSLAIPFILFYFAFYIRWPIQGSLLDDWFLFNSSITFYFVGYFLADLPAFWNTCEIYRKHFLTVAVVCVIVLFWKYYWTITLPTQQNEALYVYGFFDGLHIWAVVLTTIGFARRYLNFSNSALVYLTTAVYPFYILHQTIIVASGYYVVQWNSPIWVKLLVLIGICFILLFGLYHFLIRPFVLTRILYGIKPKQIRLPKGESFLDQVSVASTL